MDTATIVASYLDRGWMPLPVPKGEKNPNRQGWQKFTLARHEISKYFSNGVNVGLLLGELSGGLVDVDLDSPEARALAPLLLPATGLISGRTSSPRSHYWYRTHGPCKTVKFQDPSANQSSDRAMLVELRSSGCQTLVYPSIHPSGDKYAWSSFGEPAEIQNKVLVFSVRRLAAAALLTRYWQPGKRHESALALAGALFRNRWTLKDTEEFVIAIASAAGDEEIEDRRKGIQTTFERFADGKTATGVPTLAKLFDAAVISKAIEWLGYRVGSGTFGTAHTKGSRENDWPDPAPFPVELRPVPKMTGEYLPFPLREWAEDIAQRMNCPLEFVAVPAIIGAAAVVGNAVAICPKRSDDWKVVPNLWGGIVARPGLLKSPALTDALKPLNRLVADAQEAYREDAKQWEIDKLVRQAKRDRLEKSIKEAVKNEQEVDTAALRAELEELADTTEPTERRYIVNDATVEKLGEILNRNPRGVLLFRDELIGWLRTLDREGHEADRPFYLEAWDGKGKYTYDRIGRGTIHINSLTLSICGGIQPGPLTHYLRDALRPSASDDGLFQRFQLLVYPDPPDDWKNVDRWPKSDAKNRAYEIYKRLDALQAEDVGALADDDDSIPYLRFEENAQAFFDEWRADLEHEVRGDLHPALEAHLSKYRSLMPSLALLFLLIEWAAGGPPGPISVSAAEMAAAWCQMLYQHAERIYSTGLDGDVVLARQLSERIKRGELGEAFLERELYRKHWSGLATKEEVRGPLVLLEEYGWIRSKNLETGGRPTVVYNVNPKAMDAT